MNCSNCNFSSYLFDCQNCEYCFLCYNLRNKKYYIENREYSPEEYHKKVKELEHQSYQSTWQRLGDMLPKAIKRNLHQIGCENSLGDTIKNTQNCFEVYFIAQAKDCKYLENGALGSYDSYDGY